MTGPLRTALSGVTILESWRWDRYEVESEVEEALAKYNAVRRKLALLDRERKLQPPLILASAIGKHRRFKVTRYHVIDEDTFCAERQEEIDGDA